MRLSVAHLDTGRSWRGGQRQVLLLMQGLRERDVDSTLVAPAGPLFERATADGFAAREWHSRSDLDVAAVLRARALLEDLAPAVVHCHSGRAHALGVPAARWAGVPHVVVSRRVDFPIARNPFSAFKYRWGVDRYICISEGVRDIMRADGIAEDRMRVVRSGVVQDRSESHADLRVELGIPVGAPVVGTIAALAPHKNHTLLMHAARRLASTHPQVHFVWLGEGGERRRLETMRHDLGLDSRVHMPGHRDDAVAILPQFDVFVLTSSTEGLGTSLLDAALAGVPIVATRTGGIVEVVVDGVTGRLVEVGDEEGIARAIRETIEDPDRTAHQVAAARDHAATFSAQAMADGTLEVYRELTG